MAYTFSVQLEGHGPGALLSLAHTCRRRANCCRRRHRTTRVASSMAVPRGPQRTEKPDRA
eukprot:359247-Chlamydomonas_euryale.AAC.6